MYENTTKEIGSNSGIPLDSSSGYSVLVVPVILSLWFKFAVYFSISSNCYVLSISVHSHIRFTHFSIL